MEAKSLFPTMLVGLGQCPLLGVFKCSHMLMHAPLYLTSHRLIYFLSKLMPGKILHETNQWWLLQRLQRQLRREEEGVIMDCSQSLFYFVWVITKQQNLSLATFSSSFQGSLVDSQWDHSKYYKVGANSIEI